VRIAMRIANGFGLHLLVCFGGLLCLAGCSGNRPMPKEFGARLPVQGTVTIDGVPLRGGNVRFFSLDRDVDQLQPEGLIDAQGKYTVSTYQVKGAPAGKYRVTVDPASDDKKQDRMVGVIYQHWEKSPLVVTVQENASPGAYDLKISSRNR
jgi:hypothetical protein